MVLLQERGQMAVRQFRHLLPYLALVLVLVLKLELMLTLEIAFFAFVWFLKKPLGFLAKHLLSVADRLFSRLPCVSHKRLHTLPHPGRPWRLKN